MLRTLLSFVGAFGVSAALSVARADSDARSFTPLSPLEPKILAAAPAFPGGSYEAKNILAAPLPEGRTEEYASHGQGARTFIDFDLGRAAPVAALRHVQRRTPDTVAAAELIFSDQPDFKRVLAKVKIKHEAQPGKATFVAFAPVTARYVRWQVTALGSSGFTNVGGQHIVFYAAGETEPSPRGIRIDAHAVPVVERSGRDHVDGSRVQPLAVTLVSPYSTPLSVVLRVAGLPNKPVDLIFGENTVELSIPAVEADRSIQLAVDRAGQPVSQREVTIRPARKTTIYILPHSHTDIGYTELQTEIEDKQVKNLLLGMEYARKTADYPAGARFVWNVEVLWAADLYLRRLDEPRRAQLLDAVKKGQVVLNGMYLNELTGLCRPEELLRLFRFATQLSRQTGVPIDSAMISDVPGYTWGTVTAMRQAGIKYFSVAPNYFDRIGDILVQWENKPFYWVGPSGKDKVLVWIPYKGYAMSHIHRELTPKFVEQYQDHLDKSGYPYDIAYMRWSGHGDNAVPDPAICEFVKQWNATHDWPRFVISGTGEAFRALEERYGARLPQVGGDWTPYWEDGAGSSALETAQNRASSDRLAQAEAVWAILGPASYPAADFEAAWRNALLYSEHTWGAWCSVGEPARRETREQWTVKQSYAVAADRQSRDLLSRAMNLRPSGATGVSSSATGVSPVPPSNTGKMPVPPAGKMPVAPAIDVLNTVSWVRSDLVVVPKYLSENRNRVVDAEGQPAASQRLRSGELVFLARDVPPLAARRYFLHEGPPHVAGNAKAEGNVLDNGQLRLRVDPASGGIVELSTAGLDANLADTASGHALNEYLYLIGDNPADLRRAGPAKITVQEPGPLVASLSVESDAPGCFRLQREVRLMAGSDHVELTNIVDKQRLVAASYHAKEGKESVNFAFPFNVPGGQVRLDVPLGVIRPDADQIPSACKNWFTVGRWADVSNADYGVTWVTLDAPLVQVGGITATLLNSQTNPEVWRKRVEPTQKLYSWAMNNHWGTNYRAYQEGPTPFRFVLCPHRRFDPVAAARLAVGLGQPLLVVDAQGPAPQSAPLLRLDSDDVLATALKPSDDGRAFIVRLFGAAGKTTDVKLTWSSAGPKRVWISDTSEEPRQEVQGAVSVPAWGVVTLRAERQ